MGTALNCNAQMPYQFNLVLMNVFVQALLWQIEKGLTLVGFLLVIMKWYEHMDAAVGDVNKSAVHYFPLIDKVEPEITWKQLV